jgi:ribonuclease P/MRP protein subunit POP8
MAITDHELEAAGNVTSPSKADKASVNLEQEDKDTTAQTSQPKRKKQKRKPHHVSHQHTLRKPSWTYFHLHLLSSPSEESPDILTAKRYLTSALQRFLGLHGAAIPVDILKLEERAVWIRVPREDATAVHEAFASWIGDGVRWVVKGRDEWLVRLAGGGDGQDLFKP